MKAKTISKILENKFKGLLNSIDNEEIKELMTWNTIITGGCITSMLLNEDVNDYDLYFKDLNTTKKVAEYFVDKYNTKNTNDSKPQVQEIDGRLKIMIKSSGVAEDIEAKEEIGQKDKMFTKESSKGKKYIPVFITANAISLSDDVQLILRFYGEPEEIHKNYDFVHCTNYWTSWGRELVLKKEALESILTKELTYTGSLYPVCSVIRLRKFIKRGWTITAGQILKILWQVSKLDLEDIDVLEDQLTGVDLVYFSSLIDVLKEGDRDINYQYISELVDEIF